MGQQLVSPRAQTLPPTTTWMAHCVSPVTLHVRHALANLSTTASLVPLESRSSLPVLSKTPSTVATLVPLGNTMMDKTVSVGFHLSLACSENCEACSGPAPSDCTVC